MAKKTKKRKRSSTRKRKNSLSSQSLVKKQGDQPNTKNELSILSENIDRRTQLLSRLAITFGAPTVLTFGASLTKSRDC